MLFEVNRLKVLPLRLRGSRLKADAVAKVPAVTHRALVQLHAVGQAVAKAKQAGLARALMLGGHAVKLGLSRYIVDLIERGFVSHIATNGSTAIHDYELASFGETSEDVEKWIKRGQFGLWQETSRLNDVIREGAAEGRGLGESVGRAIEEGKAPNRDLSIFAAAYRCGVSATVHVTIGADIIHSMPNCDGAALGLASYRDFLIFARSVQDLEGGVFLNVGSAVTGPEVYLKALSMARNVAHQRGEQIRDFTTAVFDLVELPDNWRDGPPPPTHPLYYFRPWKTILCRTVSDGGRSYYIRGDFTETIPALRQAILDATNAEAGPAA